MPLIAELAIEEGPLAPPVVQITDEDIEAYVDEMICKPGLTDYVPMSMYVDPNFEPDWAAFLLMADAFTIECEGEADAYAADIQYRQELPRGWW